MNIVSRALAVSIIAIGFILHPSGNLKAELGNNDDKSLSPYFFVNNGDPSVDSIPLKSTKARVNIAGVIADVVVTQEYKNNGKRPIEATYVFPASTRAAVYAMKMTIGKRTIIADIKEREQARKDYEDAKAAGKSASLLEQQRPNVFQMNVANILPGDLIAVELKYTELIEPKDGRYEFVYPTVVGPRYSNQKADDAKANDRWIANPYLKAGKEAPYAFDISVHLAAGMPIQKVASPSHRVSISYSGESDANIALDRSESAGGNRDYILSYELSGGKIESGLLLFEGKDENFFLAMIEPPQQVQKAQIPPREYIFVLDVSGSMNGYPLDITKKMMKELLSSLRPVDRFNVLLFAGGSSLFAEKSLEATPRNVSQAENMIDNEHGGGGTEILPALKQVLALPAEKGFSRSIVVATDGYVSVETEVFDLIRRNLGNANLFPMGIGTSVNRFIIEGMARAGQSEPVIITQQDDASAKATALKEMISSPVLTKIRMNADGFSTSDIEPISIPDLFARKPVIVFGKYRGQAVGKLKIAGQSSEGRFEKSFDVATVKPSADNLALRYLWARNRIATLGDYNQLQSSDARIKEITNLGLRYNLLTAFTSFVAIDNEVRTDGKNSVRVNQPLPMPQGISNLAVGQSAASFAKSAMPGAAPMARDEESKVKLRAADKDLTIKQQDKPAQSKPIIKIVSTTGGLSAAQINQILNSNSATIFATISTHNLLTIKIDIDPSGAVTSLKANGAVMDDELRKLFDTIRAIKFPASSRGSITTIELRMK